MKLIYEIPLAEIITNFFYRLKSVSKGYAYLYYEIYRFKKQNMVRLDILINNNMIAALSKVVLFERAYQQGHQLLKKIKLLLSKQLFDIKIKAVVCNKIVSHVKIKAIRKNVTAKCYGGDVTRKKKLIEKQKEGKKRIAKTGKLELTNNKLLSLLNKPII